MKILYLKSYYYPEAIASPYLGIQTQEAFAKEGYKMELFTSTPSRGLDKETIKKYRKIRKEENLNGMLTIHRFPLYAEGKNPLLRALRYFIQCVELFFIGVFNKHAKNADVIMISSTPPIIGPTAVLIKKIRHIPIIYNLQDIFPDSLVGAGMTQKGSFLWKIGRVIEDFTYRNCDKIVVISEDFKRNIMQKGVPEEKIEVIYNWVDEEKVKYIPRNENKLFDKYGLDKNKFYVTYSGNIGFTQNMNLLLSVAKDLENMSDIQFVVIGDGSYKEKLLNKIAENKISNIKLLPFQPYEDISCVFSMADVGLVISKPGVGENSVPSKTWSIMSASRPVLANFDENELKSIIEDNKCGIFTKAGDKDAFIRAILQLYKDRDLCQQFGRNARKYVEQNLTKKVGTRKYVEVVKSVVNKK